MLPRLVASLASVGSSKDGVIAVAIVLFGLGFFTVLTRRTAPGALSGTALMLQAAGLELVAMHHFGGVTSSSRGDGALVLASLLAAASGGNAAIAAALVLMGRRPKASSAAP